MTSSILLFFWSGITTKFDKALFFKMLETYQKSGEIIDKDSIEAAFYGSFICIDWLAYNIERATNATDIEQKALGVEQAHLTLETMLRLYALVPDLISEVKTTLENIIF